MLVVSYSLLVFGNFGRFPTTPPPLLDLAGASDLRPLIRTPTFRYKATPVDCGGAVTKVFVSGRGRCHPSAGPSRPSVSGEMVVGRETIHSLRVASWSFPGAP